MAMTIRDIAREAGVSTATVSRALRGLPNVDPVTRERVRQVAERLDYVVSPAASRLASGRAGSIAVITPYIARWYFGRVLSGIEKVLQASDLDLLLSSIGDPSETHRVPPHRKLRRRVDGFLVISLSTDTEGVSEIFEADVPGRAHRHRARGLLVGRHRRRLRRADGRAAPDQPRARAHRPDLRPAAADAVPPRGEPLGRLPRRAASTPNLPVEPDLEACGHFTIEGGERAMTTLLARPNPPTAVFAMSDEMAFGALRALRAHGLQPGRDVSVVGFDGHEMSEHLDLTTIVQPVEEIGARAAMALLEALDHPTREPQQLTLPLEHGRARLHRVPPRPRVRSYRARARISTSGCAGRRGRRRGSTPRRRR